MYVPVYWWVERATKYAHKTAAKNSQILNFPTLHTTYCVSITKHQLEQIILVELLDEANVGKREPNAPIN